MLLNIHKKVAQTYNEFEGVSCNHACYTGLYYDLLK